MPEPLPETLTAPARPPAPKGSLPAPRPPRGAFLARWKHWAEDEESSAVVSGDPMLWALWTHSRGPGVWAGGESQAVLRRSGCTVGVPTLSH